MQGAQEKAEGAPKTWDDEAKKAKRRIGNQTNGSAFTLITTALTPQTESAYILQAMPNFTHGERECIQKRSQDC